MTSGRRIHILHLTDGNRGGSQRTIIDLTRSSPAEHRHFIVRVAAETIGVHDVDAQRLLTLDRARLSEWPAFVDAMIDTLDIGCIHVHALGPLADAVAGGARLIDLSRCCVTLHDVRAVDPAVFETPRTDVVADRDWIARCAPLLERAAAVTVPSQWMAQTIAEHYPRVAPVVIAHGIDRPAPVDVAVRPPWPPSTRVYAVVGAVGAHKGSRTLNRVATALPAGIAGVVIGYTDLQTTRGWAIPDRLYVHGDYRPDTLPALLAGYGCRLVYFPNIVPESFSYVLSEVWQAGMPVIVPPHGALGARVGASGAGFVLDDPLDAAAAADLIQALLDEPGQARLARAASRISALDAVPDVQTMGDRFAALYARVGTPASRTVAGGWARIVEQTRGAHFEGIGDSLLDAQWPALVREESALRTWNEKLVSDLEVLARRLEVDVGELKARNDRVEADAAALRERVVALANGTEVRTLRERNDVLEQHVVSLRARNLHVENDVNALVARNAQLEGDLVALSAHNLKLDADIAALKERNVLIEAGIAAIKLRNARVESDAATLAAELSTANERLAGVDADLVRKAQLERAFRVLPASLQTWLFRR